MPIALPLPPPIFVAACATPPRTQVVVTAGVDPWHIGPTVDSAQLDRMAKQTGIAGRHQPYGFYSATVAYAVAADIGNTASDICRGPIVIHLTMRLTNRHIGVAGDIPAGSCRFGRIAAHYRHHAEADQAVFQRYVLKVEAVLDELPTPALVAASRAGHGTDHIPAVVDAVIEPVLARMDAARTAARQAVDTPDEVENLEQPCNDRS